MLARMPIARSSSSLLKGLIALGVMSALSLPVLAQDRAAREQRVINEIRALADVPEEVSDAELKENMKDYLERREVRFQEQKRLETSTVNNAVGGASVVARCAEGYVTGRRIQSRAEDVQIASEARIDCDTVGCRAIQVDAFRANSAPFSVSVSVSCSG